jgi:predicted DNA-binding protein with PD1-like motif
MIKVVDLHTNFPISLLFIVQIVFRIHVHLVHVVISLEQVISLGGLLHKMGVLTLEVTFFTVETLELLVNCI